MTSPACRVPLLRMLTLQSGCSVSSLTHSSVHHRCSTSTRASALICLATSSSQPPTTSNVIIFTCLHRPRLCKHVYSCLGIYVQENDPYVVGINLHEGSEFSQFCKGAVKIEQKRRQDVSNHFVTENRDFALSDAEK